jgi:glycosyltransferase involved in cell wall biosynthesis
MVSVVIPTFRREELVVAAARSALSQTGVTLEVLVVDDSPEGSAERAVASLDDPRVRYVRRAQPSGGMPALVRNDGLALARGRYVHFLDDDDLLEDGALAATTAALERAPRTGVAVGVAVPFGDDPDALAHEQAYFGTATRKLRSLHSRFALVATMLFDSTPLVNSECTIRRSCAHAVGGYATNVALCEDVDFYLRAIRRCGFVFVDRAVVRYRIGIPSLMHSSVEPSRIRESYRRIYDRYRREHGLTEFTALRAMVVVSSLMTSVLLLLSMDSCGGL